MYLHWHWLYFNFAPHFNIFTSEHRKSTTPTNVTLKHWDIFYFSYSMYIKRIHSKVVGVHIEGVEHLLESHLFSDLFQHDTVRISLVCFLDKCQQVFLWHAGSCMNMRVHLRDRNDVYVQSTGQTECMKFPFSQNCVFLLVFLSMTLNFFFFHIHYWKCLWY